MRRRPRRSRSALVRAFGSMSARQTIDRGEPTPARGPCTQLAVWRKGEALALVEENPNIVLAAWGSHAAPRMVMTNGGCLFQALYDLRAWEDGTAVAMGIDCTQPEIYVARWAPSTSRSIQVPPTRSQPRHRGVGPVRSLTASHALSPRLAMPKPPPSSGGSPSCPPATASTVAPRTRAQSSTAGPDRLPATTHTSSSPPGRIVSRLVANVRART